MEYIQIFGFTLLVGALWMKFGWKACPKCQSRLTTEGQSEPSFDSHRESWYVDTTIDCHSCGKSTTRSTSWTKLHPVEDEFRRNYGHLVDKH